MTVLFDFLHPVDINFFNNIISKLNEERHRIILTYRERGPVGVILKKEFPSIPTYQIGTHKGSFVSKVLGQLIRDFQLFWFIRKNKINIGLSFGPSIGLSCFLNKVPFVSFADDPEYKLTLNYARLFSSQLIMPNVPNLPPNIITYKGYKELAYLHPKYFQEDLRDIFKLGIEKNRYVFIREISNTSLNYKNKKDISKKFVKRLKQLGLIIVLSLEDKSQKNEFSDDCIVLEEPLCSVHTIIKNALFTISSGDTVARESCLLGVPCIYTGGREMRINQEFIRIGIMVKLENENSIISTIDTMANLKYKRKYQEIIKSNIESKWDNITDIIYDIINSYNIA